YKKKASSCVDDSVTTYSFYCAQLEGEQSKHAKVDDPNKQRARIKMDRFKCAGWLHISTKGNDLQLATVHMTHHVPHTPYVDISVPKQVKETVESMKNLPASKIWGAVLKANPQIELNEKQIYRYW
ncbi:hypothetical protein B0H19DRAFT_896245, partial [Mycena capillaripes]